MSNSGVCSTGRGNGKAIKAKARTKATADFSTAAAKCAAFGRNDDLGDWREETTIWVTGDEMTMIGCGTLLNEDAIRNYS